MGSLSPSLGREDSWEDTQPLSPSDMELQSPHYEGNLQSQASTSLVPSISELPSLEVALPFTTEHSGVPDSVLPITLRNRNFLTYNGPPGSVPDIFRRLPILEHGESLSLPSSSQDSQDQLAPSVSQNGKS